MPGSESRWVKSSKKAVCFQDTRQQDSLAVHDEADVFGMRFGRTGFLFVFIVPTFVVSYTKKKRHFESNWNDGIIVAILEKGFQILIVKHG
jgi:hypothetical protein